MTNIELNRSAITTCFKKTYKYFILL